MKYLIRRAIMPPSSWRFHMDLGQHFTYFFIGNLYLSQNIRRWIPNILQQVMNINNKNQLIQNICQRRKTKQQKISRSKTSQKCEKHLMRTWRDEWGRSRRSWGREARDSRQSPAVTIVEIELSLIRNFPIILFWSRIWHIFKQGTISSVLKGLSFL